MDRPSFMRHGVVKLPPGFRFHPTDEELVVQYLKRKVFSCPLPASIIPEIDLGKYNPWELPGGSEQERYFFYLREAKYPNGNRLNRATGCGYWKATGKDKKVLALRSNQVVGMKKVLVFYHGNPPRGSRTDWIMHEYRLAGAETRTGAFPQRKNSTHFSMVPTKDWVLCRIFKKKRATKMGVDVEEYCEDSQTRNGGIGFIDFMGLRDGSPRSSSPSSSESSCVTEFSDGSSNGDEATCSDSLSPP
uniref:NAC domain-containing protein 83 n=1 Tax=Elaeis guineensis var. tenera TaxID=51953 RepID=A0A6I9QF73_ELAGV|nr:NAC domain-containing protein 83 [Elaeis guineensis]